MRKKVMLLAAMTSTAFLFDEGGGCDFDGGWSWLVVGGLSIGALLLLSGRTSTTSTTT